MRTKIAVLFFVVLALVGCATRTIQSTYAPYAPMSVEPPGVAIPDVGGVSVTGTTGSSVLSSDQAIMANAGVPLGSDHMELRLGVRGQLGAGAIVTSDNFGLLAIDLQAPKPLVTAGLGLRVNRPVGPRTHLGVRLSPTVHDTREHPALALDVAGGWSRAVGSSEHRPFAELRGQITVTDTSLRSPGGWGGVAGGVDFALARGGVHLRPFGAAHVGRQRVFEHRIETTTTPSWFSDAPAETVTTRSTRNRMHTLMRVEVGMTMRFGRSGGVNRSRGPGL